MKGYRAETYSQIERLVFMAFYSGLRRLLPQPASPDRRAGSQRLMGRIAKDEERHEQFFHNLVAHCLESHREETRRGHRAPRRRPRSRRRRHRRLPGQGQGRRGGGIFDEGTLRQVISDRITHGVSPTNRNCDRSSTAELPRG